MNKLILLTLFFASSAFSDSFDHFLQMALQNNPKLKAAKIQIEQSALKARTLTRYENPNLEGSLAKYEDKNGYALGLSQKIPLPNTQRDLKQLGTLLKKQAVYRYQLLRAELVKTFSQKYLNFKQKSALYQLAFEESKLAKKIYDISTARHKAGTIAKSKLLQAKLAYHQSLQQQNALQLEKEQAYYSMLLDAGISREITMDGLHQFMLTKTKSENPILALLLLNQKIAHIRAKTDTRVLESFSLFGEFEKEPEQNIVRLGVSLPIGIFNQKSEEKKIANLSIQKEKFSLQKYQRRLDLELHKLQKERLLLQKMKKQNSALIKEQKKILIMFEEGYRIANINLLELQDLKNRLIQTQKEHISIKTRLNQNTITRNYLNGVYND